MTIGVSLSRVLIVGHDNDVLLQIKKNLEKFNVNHVECMTNGSEAMTVIDAPKEPYDLILVDLKMPGLSGTSLIQKCMRNIRNKTLGSLCFPIAGNMTKDEIGFLREFNFSDFITKPISEAVFKKEMTTIIEIRKNNIEGKSTEISVNNFVDEKKYKAAEEVLIAHIKKDPTSKKYLTMFSELLIRMNQLKRAEDILEKVLKMDPSFVQALNLMSKIYVKSKRFDDAINILERAKGLNPYNVDRMLVMGELNLGLNNCESAENNFRSVLKLDPTDERAVFGLGRTLASVGKIEESKKVLSQVKKSAELSIYFNNKGVLLVKSGHIQEGITLYQNALKIMEDKEREYLFLYNIALAYTKLGENEKALEYALNAKQKSPKDYLKPERLIEKLTKDIEVQAPKPNKNDDNEEDRNLGVRQKAQAQNLSVKNEPIFTGEQMAFIMEGFDEPAQESSTTYKDQKADDE